MQGLKDAYISGEWNSLNRVLSLLQTYDDNMLCRKKLYRDIFDMRPTGKVSRKTNPMAKDLRHPKYSVRVVKIKNKKLHRKRKHKNDV